MFSVEYLLFNNDSFGIKYPIKFYIPLNQETKAKSLCMCGQDSWQCVLYFQGIMSSINGCVYISRDCSGCLFGIFLCLRVSSNPPILFHRSTIQLDDKSILGPCYGTFYPFINMCYYYNLHYCPIHFYSFAYGEYCVFVIICAGILFYKYKIAVILFNTFSIVI